MLSSLVPNPFVRLFAAPYVAGDSQESALDTAASLLERRLTTTLDLLGEDVRNEAQIQSNVEVYESLIKKVAQDPRFQTKQTRPSVSVKPSAFTTGSKEAVVPHLERLAACAHEHNVALTIDMEDHRWTDLTLALSTQLFERGLEVGTVLQTRLHRTEEDLEKIPAGMRIRLVIGIYPEPAQIATTDKAEMKSRMVRYAKRLLERGARVEFATHDEGCIESFLKEAAPLAPERCEVQMLLGVPRSKQQASLLEGGQGPALPVRVYVPFAIGWDDATAYLRRRMDESPNIIWLVLRNLFVRGG